MARKIAVNDLRIGMYIDKLGGSWLNHPFLRSSFLLDEKKDLLKIQQSGIKEIWIDEQKGLSLAQVKQKETPEVKTDTPPEKKEEVKKEPKKPRSMEMDVERARAFCGAAKDQIENMFEDVRLGKAIDTESVLPLVGQIDTLVNENAAAIISVARLKTHDNYTYMHSVAVCALMLSLAKQLQLDENTTRLAGIGGLMHDMGKAFMPLQILNKEGSLTDQEFDTVKKHPEVGAKVLEKSGAEPEVVDISLHHHEKVNGKGYPHGLMGDEISLLARMAAVCDVYDAITSERAYKKPWCPAEAIHKMAQWEGHFDKAIFNAFVKTVGIYPIGSLVRLSNKRLAVVVEPGVQSLLKPKVKAFFSITSGAQIPVQLIDLASPSCQVSIEGPESIEDWHFKDLESMWQ
jgi:putative nucleotidyltransferase with HDIG domain